MSFVAPQTTALGHPAPNGSLYPSSADPFGSYQGQANFGAFNHSNASDLWGSIIGHDVPSKSRSQSTDMFFVPDVNTNTRPYLLMVVTQLATEIDKWPNRVFLPWKDATDMGNEIMFDALVFDKAMAGSVPVLGVPHTVTHSRSSRSVTLKRTGLAVQIPDDTLLTPGGAKIFAMSLMQVADGIVRFAAADAQRAIMENSNEQYADAFAAIDGNVQRSTFFDLLTHEVKRFGFTQQTFGFVRTIDSVISGMAQRGIDANAIVVPEKVIRMTSERPEYRDQIAAGSPSSLEQDMSRLGISKKLGRLDVYPLSSMSWGESGDMNTFDASSQSCSFGQFATMYDPSLGSSIANRSNRAIKLYDAAEKRVAEISYEDAVNRCGFFGADGRLHTETYNEVLGALNGSGDANFPALRTSSQKNPDLFIWKYGNDAYIANYIGDLSEDNLVEEQLDTQATRFLDRFAPYVDRINDGFATIAQLGLTYAEVLNPVSIAPNPGTLVVTTMRSFYTALLYISKEARAMFPDSLLASLNDADYTRQFFFAMYTTEGASANPVRHDAAVSDLEAEFQARYGALFDAVVDVAALHHLDGAAAAGSRIFGRKSVQPYDPAQPNPMYFSPQFCRRYMERAPSMHTMAVRLLLISRVSKKSFISLNNNRLYSPLAFIVQRPDIRLSTRKIVVGVAGESTGVTYYKPGVVEKGNNALQQYTSVTVTAHIAAGVINPQNLVGLDNGFIENYASGMSTVIYNAYEHFAAGNRRNGGDMLVIPTSDAPLYRITSMCIPSSGIYDLAGVHNREVVDEVALNIPEYVGCWAQQQRFGLQGQSGTRSLAMQDDVAISGLLFRSEFETFNANTGEIDTIVPGTGHLSNFGHYLGARHQDIFSGVVTYIHDLHLSNNTKVVNTRVVNSIRV